MKYFILILPCLFYAAIAKPQSIIAGKHTSADYYHFSYDTLIDCNCTKHPSCSHMDFPVDINGDGVVDFSFGIHNSAGALGAADNVVFIASNDSNKVAFGFNHPCSVDTASGGGSGAFKVVKVFHNNDTISGSETWENSLYIFRDSFVMGVFSCYGSATDDNELIIGTRILKNGQLLYGWIQINSVSASMYDAHFAIVEYACKADTNEKNGAKDNSVFKIHPNPSKDIISVVLPDSVQLAVAYISGINCREIIKKVLRDRISQMDISALPAGVYFIKIVSNNIVDIEKIIKE